ncbi:hypothetical protein TNCT_514611 [Trichonephila clavata]|uniref:Uncharacterized protein n=1 Tax=Trichonephila clavata TaxID=2740835 RepID=A0A8X6GVF3_TRICU|nr:hypothetical protein TNCT_514611 [Trichonephila clavata]
MEDNNIKASIANIVLKMHFTIILNQTRSGGHETHVHRSILLDADHLLPTFKHSGSSRVRGFRADAQHCASGNREEPFFLCGCGRPHDRSQRIHERHQNHRLGSVRHRQKLSAHLGGNGHNLWGHSGPVQLEEIHKLARK